MKKYIAILAVLAFMACVYVFVKDDGEQAPVNTPVIEDVLKDSDEVLEKETEVSEYITGEQLLNAYLEATAESTDLDAIADKLVSSFGDDVEKTTIEVGTEYLDGFDGEIAGYTEAVAVKPIISAIPMVTYVFKTDDAEALLATLTETANPRWNICTEAGETVSYSENGLVLFAMLPGEEAE